MPQLPIYPRQYSTYSKTFPYTKNVDMQKSTHDDSLVLLESINIDDYQNLTIVDSTPELIRLRINELEEKRYRILSELKFDGKMYRVLMGTSNNVTK